MGRGWSLDKGGEPQVGENWPQMRTHDHLGCFFLAFFGHPLVIFNCFLAIFLANFWQLYAVYHNLDPCIDPN